MLRDPLINPLTGLFSDDLALRDDSHGSSHRGVPSVARSLSLLPNGASCIGFGAFGTVRVGWVQERKQVRSNDSRAAGNSGSFKPVFGTVAAVAVKRVIIPQVVRGQLDSRRQHLIRELQVMEHIRLFPHPNVVQCWGFLFGDRDKSASSQPAFDQTFNNHTGQVLTSLSKERQRLKGSCGGDIDKLDDHILNSALYFDVCLSLCTGGTLSDYMRRVIDQLVTQHTAHAQGFVSNSPTNTGDAVSDKLCTERVSDEQHGLTRSTTGGTGGETECTVSHTNSQRRRPIAVDTAVEELSLSSSKSDVAELAVRERDIVAIAYALINALHHTHKVLRTLHRDIKPANILICEGVGKAPVYALQAFPSANQGQVTTEFKIPNPARDVSACEQHKREGVVELLLFSDRRTALGDSQTSSMGEEEGRKGVDCPAPEALIVPLESQAHHEVCIAGDTRWSPFTLEFLPQVDSWRVQLADYGIASGVGCLTATGRCGTIPFMAPEVSQSGQHSAMYDTAADVYSLGVTLQHLLVNVIVEGGDATGVTLRRMEALGTQWVDEEVAVQLEEFPNTNAANAEVGVSTPTTEGKFVLPSAWRCERELSSGQHVRLSPGAESCENGDFTVPRTWRCHDELSTGLYVRTEPRPGEANCRPHDHLHAKLPNGSEDVDDFVCRESRRARCKSCGKIHRHLIELLNSMTSQDPSQRPSLSTVIRSSAIIEQGNFVRGRISMNHNARKCKGNESANPGPLWPPRQKKEDVLPSTTLLSRSGTTAERKATDTVADAGCEKHGVNEESSDSVLWRPPSLRFLRASCTMDRLVDVQA
ncbi:Protein kinase domain [Trypanosoma vivax]|nr:putative protein kinase [Trypanosoma vivax]KAH8611750.1 Protein kinase domain [Trypanosoma vivax]